MTPPGPEGAAVCCMCGDHGLPQELFPCKCCRVRLQHRYCSDLYPRAPAYGRCNWCLREVGGASSVKSISAVEKRKMSDQARSDDRRDGCSRRSAAEAGRPIKKRKAEERVEDAAAKGKMVQVAGKARFRVKVRRYKLLEEVISC